MNTFKLVLADNTTLSGIRHIPAQKSSRPKYCPLVVGLHGGCYNSGYFDATPDYTASLTSDSLSVPFVAIDRPGYVDSTPVTPIPEGSSFPEEWGTKLHQYILPALWTGLKATPPNPRSGSTRGFHFPLHWQNPSGLANPPNPLDDVVGGLGGFGWIRSGVVKGTHIFWQNASIRDWQCCYPMSKTP
ncbi:hypothetical protein MRS44_016335 [Fusarium solani]|uniref:uncharacterized protein n=1 Tax=Fusarium solani TaxID=169388 RepID=UPI0032C405FA|nr:hypothetical protein MRS44_016335 [Fusarium solani]